MIRLLRDYPPDPVVVVTSDRDLQRRARGHGATIASARQFLWLIQPR